MRDYKPFLIAVGVSGCYTEMMEYEEPFDTKSSYNLWIKHAPYKVFPQIKDIVTQDWKDEQGEDVWLPPTGVMSAAYDYDVEFVYYENDGMANENIRAFIERIKGKWLKIYDTYTGLGRKGVYVKEFDADPPFKRRANSVGSSRDYVSFKVKFRVNDPNTDVLLVLGESGEGVENVGSAESSIRDIDIAD